MTFKVLSEWNEYLANEQSTYDCGAKLSHLIVNHSVIIYLYGELGAGKTTLVRGILRGLGNEETVKSPTYSIVETYDLEKNTIFHFDLYRVSEAEELEFIGIHDYFAQSGIFLIEWPEHGTGLIPPPDLTGYLHFEDQGRKITLQANSEQGLNVLESFINLNNSTV